MSAHQQYLKTQQYLTTLRRIPDDVILSMATRPIDLWRSRACVCGWAAREVMARNVGADADDVNGGDITGLLARELGGDRSYEWLPINWAYVLPANRDAIEDAFVERVLECVE